MNDFQIDVTLVKKAQQGDVKALEALCTSSMRTVYYVALKILKNEADAEDIMSDTMVAVVEKLNTLSEPAAYISWVNRIAVNKCKNYLAKNKPIYLGDDEQEIIENTELENFNEEFLPEEFVLSNEKKSALMEIIKDKTTYAEMMSIIMFYYNGDSIKTIAAEMDCAEITVKTRLASARKKIKKGLEDKFGKGVMLMATGLFVLGKAFKAEASEMVVPEAVANTALAAVNSNMAMATGTKTVEHTSAVNAVGNIGKKVGKEVVKNSLKTKIIVGVAAAVAVVGIGVGVAALGGNSGISGGKNNESDKEGTKTESSVSEEEKKAGETYKCVYTKDGVFYFANHEEQIIKLEGVTFDGMIHHNVTCGYNEENEAFLVDANGKYIVETGVYDRIIRYNAEFFGITKDNKRGFINYKGEVIIPAEYSDIDFIDYSEEDEGVVFFIAKKGEKYYIISDSGKVIVEKDEKIQYLDATVYKALNDSEETLKYEGVLYGLESGKELLTGLDKGTYYNHLYAYENTLTVYDADFKVKTVMEDVKVKAFERADDGRPVVWETGRWYLNEDYKLVEYEKQIETVQKNDKYIVRFENKESKAYICNSDDEVQEEFTDIDIVWVLADGYRGIVGNDGTVKVVDTETGKITMEIDNKDDIGYIPHVYVEENVAVIELKDGLYRLDGKKLIELN